MVPLVSLDVNNDGGTRRVVTHIHAGSELIGCSDCLLQGRRCLSEREKAKSCTVTST